MKIELTAHRLGGPDGDPRAWGPTTCSLNEGDVVWQTIEPANGPAYAYLRLDIRDVALTDEEFGACTLRLSTMNGQPLGTRPALLYVKPYDVPTYTQFRSAWLGVFSVGLRVIQ